MADAAKNDPAIAKRLKLFQFRVLEEFYDFKNDPDALSNRIDNPEYAEKLSFFQKKLEDWMVKYQDPALDAFRNRKSKEALEKFMEEQDKKVKRNTNTKTKTSKNKKKNKKKK